MTAPATAPSSFAAWVEAALAAWFASSPLDARMAWTTARRRARAP
jgi:hypothetical protein